MASVTGMLIEFAAKTTQLDAAFKKTENNMNSLQNKAKETQSNFAQLTGSAVKFLGVFGGTAAIFGFMTSLSQTTREFSKAIADLSAITGATGKDLKFLSDASKEFGQTTTYSAAKVAEAFKLVGSVKADLLSNLPALKAVTAEVITLSTAAGIDLATAADVTGTALNQFGLEAREASRVVNVLAAGSKFGAAEVRDIGDALKYVGPVAAQMGISIEDTVAAIELLAQAGIKGSEAGTGLRATLLRLADQTDGSINPSVVGLTKAMENLKLKNYSVTEATNLFGQNAVTAGLALARFADQQKTMSANLTGTKTAMEQAAAQLDSYDAKLTKLTNSYENFKLAVGESGESKSIIEGMTSALNDLANGINQKGIVGGILIGKKPEQNAEVTAADVTRMNMGLNKGANFQDRVVMPSSIPSAPTAGDFIAQNTKSLMNTGQNGFDPAVIKDTMDSFIKPIKSAGDMVTQFSETAQQASNRLQNTFSSSFGDPAKKVADSLIGKMGADEQQKFDNAAKNIDPRFLQKTQEAAALVSQIQASKGDERNQLAQKLESIQNDLNYQAFSPSSGSFGQIGAAAKNGGTFSVTGGQGAGAEEQRVLQAIIGDLNKFVAQQLQEEQKVTVTIVIDDPANTGLVKFVQTEAEKTIKDVAKKAAMQGAK